MARSTIKPKISGMQREWVLAYLADPKRNATEAARVAKYANPEQSGWENRHNPSVQQYIREFFEEQEATAAEAIAVLSKQMRGTIEHFLHFPENDDGEDIFVSDPEVDLKKARDAEQLDLIKKYKKKRTIYTDKDGNETVTEWLDLELHDAQSAADKIVRAQGGYKDSLDINAAINDTGLTVEEWREEAAKRRQAAAATAALFDNVDTND
jgi:hypothetical protein